MATKISLNISSGNGLLPDNTKPLPEAMLTFHQRGSVAFAREQFHRNSWSYPIEKLVWKLNFDNYFHITQVPNLKTYHFHKINLWPIHLSKHGIFISENRVRIKLATNTVSQSRYAVFEIHQERLRYLVCIVLPIRLEWATAKSGTRVYIL